VSAAVDLGELVVGACEADLQSLDLSEPASALCFADPGGQVVADLGDGGTLGRVGLEHSPGWRHRPAASRSIRRSGSASPRTLVPDPLLSP
jgi:hypothetical protein